MGLFKRKSARTPAVPKPDINQMRESNDIAGLVQAMEYTDSKIRVHAAFALAAKDVDVVTGVEKRFIEVVKNDAGLDEISATDKKMDLEKLKIMFSDVYTGFLIPELRGDNLAAQLRALIVLITEKENAVEPLIQYALKYPEWGVRGLATVALEKIGEPAVLPLIKALKDKESTVRFGAAVVLGDMGIQAAVEPLKALLTDTDERVQTAAAEALAKIAED